MARRTSAWKLPTPGHRARRRGLTVAAFGVMVVISVGAAIASVTPGGGAQWSSGEVEHVANRPAPAVPHVLTFTSDRSGVADLYAVGRGGRARRLTFHRAPLSSPALSPDGKWIAAVGAGGTWLMRRDGSGLRRLRRPDGGALHAGVVAWSPNGRRVALIQGRNRNGVTTSMLVVVNRSGGGLRRLVDDANQPSWAPDGASLVFVRKCRVLRVWLGTGRVVRLVTPRGRCVRAAHLDPSGRRLAMVMDNGRVVVSGAGGGAGQVVRGSWGVSAAAWSPDGRRLAMAVGGGWDDERNAIPGGVIVSSVSGQHRRRLMWGNGSEPSAVSWSRGGWILTDWHEPDDERFYLLRADGPARPRGVGPDPPVDPVWSPDGSKVAYLYRRRVWVRDLATGRDRLIGLPVETCEPTCLHIDEHDVAWSPDSTRVAFSQSAELSDWEHVVVRRVDGTGPRIELYPPDDLSGYTFNPTWSPDGAWLAYGFSDPAAETEEAADGVFVSRSNGKGAARRLASGRDPDWSPDGRLIVYSRRGDRTGGGGIWVVAPKPGATPRLLRAGTDRGEGWPAWSPDGTEIAWVHATDPTDADATEPSRDIWLMNADGSEARPIPANSPAADYEPRWTRAQRAPATPNR